MPEKRCLIIRYGAYGDSIIISSIIKKLKEDGYYVILDTMSRGLQVFQEDPNIDEFIKHDEDMSIHDTIEFWKNQKKSIKHDKYINFSESIEMNLALHHSDPLYWEPKYKRFDKCSKNYYEESVRWAEIEDCSLRPVIFFTDEEHKAAKEPLEEGKFNILWGLSGSGYNKLFPWAEYVMRDVLNKYPNVHFITVGDEKCQQLEFEHPRVTRLAGRIPMRLAMCMTGHVDLVVCPDTGLLHASGAYDTPKIGLLGHTNIENITKHFINDYSIEAKCACAPCFRLVYDQEVQCPMNPLTHSTWCLSEGISAEQVFKQIKRVINEHSSF